MLAPIKLISYLFGVPDMLLGNQRLSSSLLLKKGKSPKDYGM
jgi:hypothetical protein